MFWLYSCACSVSFSHAYSSPFIALLLSSLSMFSACFFIPLSGAAEALKTLKEGWQRAVDQRGIRVAESRGGLPAHGGTVRMEMGRACLGFLPDKNLPKSKVLLGKKKHSDFHCVHPSKKVLEHWKSWSQLCQLISPGNALENHVQQTKIISLNGHTSTSPTQF